ncbi:hypothetical protein J0383_06295 [Flavobacterium endoglycinae]|uniref:Leucine-rich repeat domain-containing protein n=1 Tax=Flavobacterium endoglycinae TaxID=2816357 RepID=A0ABX7QJ55_9FLAO|nr:leucine-rich repeat domain-containing protein [Flavobacterium endoglycinae]QSW90416.1 hypothetical protein J0383_06295 [Flavobacterium endoglycinae]
MYLVIDCHKNNLQGNIPNLIGNLKKLEVFSFSSNQFSGSIPETICKLKNLKDLELSKNNLSGTIPSEWETVFIGFNRRKEIRK